MHRTARPIRRDLVLAGGGHAHALVLRRFAMRPPEAVRLTLIDPVPAAAYTGMLPGYAAGHYARHEVMVDLVALAQAAGARLVLDRVTGIDRAARQVALADGPPVAYDVLSLDVGAGTAMPELPGFAEHALAAKPFGAFADRWEAFLADPAARPAVAVLGGGAGGAELAMACAYRLAPRQGRVTLIERGPAIAATLPAAARRRLAAALAGRGVTVLTGAAPAAVDAAGVTLADGRRIAAGLVIGAAGVRPPAWLADSGLALHAGFVAVDRHLQSSDPAVFAAGDCAHLAASPRPKAGVYAVRAAPVLAANLAAALAGAPLRGFRPQRDHLKLIAEGGRSALAEKAGLVLAAPWLWRLKDRIDRRFLARLTPAPAPAGDDPPLCGGCGAKVGAAALAEGLAGLPPGDRLAGPGDDAALLETGGARQLLSTDLLRALTLDEAVMAEIAANHALGDIWAMGAEPQGALATVVLPRAAPAIEARMLARLMAGARRALAAAGCPILGGHTASGAELMVGFAVTGLMPPGAAVRTKGGARPGDALLLTKPLGTGTVLAAAMAQRRAPGVVTGEAAAAALGSMRRPSATAAAILAPAARAMTDVTGFGLAGHLLEMLAAAGAGAEIALAALPLLPGAEALAAAGAASSLAPANRAFAAGRVQGAEGARGALLFDPQTCGGLLAAVPAGRAEALLAELAAAGVAAARIGRVREGPPVIAVSR
jgi:selenide,water dikinase